MSNRSIPQSTVIPVLVYTDVTKAAQWLCAVFGFTERVRIGNHRIQLKYKGGDIVIAEPKEGYIPGEHTCHSVMIRVSNVDEHYAKVLSYGVHILQPPTSFPYGERQYNVIDFEGTAGHLPKQ